MLWETSSGATVTQNTNIVLPPSQTLRAFQPVVTPTASPVLKTTPVAVLAPHTVVTIPVTAPIHANNTVQAQAVNTSFLNATSNAGSELNPSLAFNALTPAVNSAITLSASPSFETETPASAPSGAPSTSLVSSTSAIISNPTSLFQSLPTWLLLVVAAVVFFAWYTGKSPQKIVGGVAS